MGKSTEPLDTVSLCWRLSGITTIIFLVVAMAAAKNAATWTEFVSAAASALLPQLGSLVMAIATIWYVVFTYGILTATKDALRLQIEPFLQVSFGTDDHVRPAVAAHHSQLSDSILNTFRAIGVTPRQGASEKLFVSLTLKNRRNARAKSATVIIHVSVAEPESAQLRLPNPKFLIEQRFDGLDLGPEKDFTFTVLDLEYVPITFHVSLTVQSVRYTAVDGVAEISDFGGMSTVKLSGALSPENFVSEVKATEDLESA